MGLAAVHDLHTEWLPVGIEPGIRLQTCRAINYATINNTQYTGVRCHRRTQCRGGSIVSAGFEII